MYKDIGFPVGAPLETAGKQELDAYLVWFQNMCLSRPSELEGFVRSTEGFEDWSADYSESSLIELEDWLSNRIRASQDTGPIGPISEPTDLLAYLDRSGLSDRSYSVLFDCGFYLGEVLRREISGSKWFQIRDGSKKFIDYGHVVLGPFKMYNFNPMRLMSSKGFAHINDQSREISLHDIYKGWTAKKVLE